MKLHRTLFMATIVALATTTAHAEKAAAFYELNVEGEVRIAPDGHVNDYRIKNELAAPVAALVRKNVLAWHFDPILVDGKAVEAKTAMHLQLHTESAGNTDEFVVRIASIDFGTPTRSSSVRPPRYPGAAIEARLGAKVVLSARLDETGKVVEAVPYQTSLDARARREGSREMAPGVREGEHCSSENLALRPLRDGRRATDRQQRHHSHRLPHRLVPFREFESMEWICSGPDPSSTVEHAGRRKARRGTRRR